MDKLIGRLDAKLGELRIRDNTLILFVGDNGTGRGVRSMCGGKLIEGGKGLTISSGMHVASETLGADVVADADRAAKGIAKQLSRLFAREGWTT